MGWDSRSRRSLLRPWRQKARGYADTAHSQESSLSVETGAGSEDDGTESVVGEDVTDLLTGAPLVIDVSVKFTDLALRSTYRRSYSSSPAFEPSDMICDGLLRRLEHCCEELITRGDSTALTVCRDGTDEPKRLRYELTFYITRRGNPMRIQRTFRSYQAGPLTVAFTRDVLLASHMMVGLFLLRHDKHFRLVDAPVSEEDHAHPQETAAHALETPLSACCVPRSRFIESSQSYESVPGYTIETFFSCRDQWPHHPVFGKVLQVASGQTSPLNLSLAEDLLWQCFEAVQSALEAKERQLDEQHGDGCDALDGTVGCWHPDHEPLHLAIRINNNLGPSYSHLRREIRCKPSLFRDDGGEYCGQFPTAITTRLAEARDRTDSTINRMNDFELRILELRSPAWSILYPATFCLGPGKSHSRQTVEAVLERVQTGIRDVLRGNDIAIRLDAYKRGHLVLEKELVARQDPCKPRRSGRTLEEEKADLLSRLSNRIQEDIDRVCKDTCSLDDLPDRPVEAASPRPYKYEGDKNSQDESAISTPSPGRPSSGRVGSDLRKFIQRRFSLIGKSKLSKTDQDRDSARNTARPSPESRHSMYSEPTGLARARETMAELAPRPSTANTFSGAAPGQRFFPLVPPRSRPSSECFTSSNLACQSAEIEPTEESQRTQRHDEAPTVASGRAVEKEERPVQPAETPVGEDTADQAPDGGAKFLKQVPAEEDEPLLAAIEPAALVVATATAELAASEPVLTSVEPSILEKPVVPEAPAVPETCPGVVQLPTSDDLRTPEESASPQGAVVPKEFIVPRETTVEGSTMEAAPVTDDTATPVRLAMLEKQVLEESHVQGASASHEEPSPPAELQHLMTQPAAVEESATSGDCAGLEQEAAVDEEPQILSVAAKVADAVRLKAIEELPASTESVAAETRAGAEQGAFTGDHTSPQELLSAMSQVSDGCFIAARNLEPAEEVLVPVDGVGPDHPPPAPEDAKDPEELSLAGTPGPEKALPCLEEAIGNPEPLWETSSAAEPKHDELSEAPVVEAGCFVKDADGNGAAIPDPDSGRSPIDTAPLLEGSPDIQRGRTGHQHPKNFEDFEPEDPLGITECVGSDNESIAPSTPGLSSSCESSPRNSLVVTPNNLMDPPSMKMSHSRGLHADRTGREAEPDTDSGGGLLQDCIPDENSPLRHKYRRSGERAVAEATAARSASGRHRLTYVPFTLPGAPDLPQADATESSQLLGESADSRPEDGRHSPFDRPVTPPHNRPAGGGAPRRDTDERVLLGVGRTIEPGPTPMPSEAERPEAPALPGPAAARDALAEPRERVSVAGARAKDPKGMSRHAPTREAADRHDSCAPQCSPEAERSQPGPTALGPYGSAPGLPEAPSAAQPREDPKAPCRLPAVPRLLKCETPAVPLSGLWAHGPATAGYLGLGRTAVVEVGLRGALGASREPAAEQRSAAAAVAAAAVLPVAIVFAGMAVVGKMLSRRRGWGGC